MRGTMKAKVSSGGAGESADDAGADAVEAGVCSGPPIDTPYARNAEARLRRERPQYEAWRNALIKKLRDEGDDW